MIASHSWPRDLSVILTRRELRTVIMDLKRKAPRSLGTRMNLTIFRLACCCGLRASEIGAVRLGDVVLARRRPHIHLPKSAGKRNQARRVPLWWDAGTLADIAAWVEERARQGACGDDLLICSMQADKRGRRLSRQAIRARFRTACKSLGPERLQDLTIHHGRHTFISHALAGGRTLAEVRDAAGHSNISITSAYLHVAVDDDGEPGQLFAL